MAKTVRGNIDPEQIRGDWRQGDSKIIQMTDGTFTSGNVPMYAADGSLTDSGSAPGGGGGGGGSGFMFPIDEPPASANAMDDEFPGSSLDGKWTVWNQQTGQTITVGNGLVTLATPYTLQKRAFGLYQPISDSAWKFRTKIWLEAMTYQYFGVYLFAQRRTSAVKTLAYGLAFIDGSVGIPSGWIWRLSGDDPSLSSEVDLYQLYSGHYYFEMEYDGTDITWRASQTGNLFSRTFKESNVSSFLGGAPEYVGIGLHPYSNSTSDPNWGGAASFDWFRRIS